MLLILGPFARDDIFGRHRRVRETVQELQILPGTLPKLTQDPCAHILCP
jgi:hypothetical protein